MTATTTKKQTAGNNVFLAKAKATFNKLIFAKVLEHMNTAGERAARDYLFAVMFYADDADLDAGMDHFIATVYNDRRHKLPALLQK